jgi:hypothetical protein
MSGAGIRGEISMLMRVVAGSLLVLAVPAMAAVPVTVDNFKRAETEAYLGIYAKRFGVGTVAHDRAAPPDTGQPVIRMNRDTLYSYVILDLTTPAMIVKPDTGKRFQSMIVINQDHYVKKVAYTPGRTELTKDSVGTRYALVLFRTFFNPEDPKDVKAAHAAQDGIQLIQADKGKLELTGFDETQREKLHDLLNQVGAYTPDTTKAFGDVQEVDPVQHLVMTSAGWGGNPRKDAIYLNEVAAANDGVTPHSLTVGKVPVDGFWSITVYNEKGFFEAPGSAASINNLTAKPNKDGTVTVRFGGDPKAPNYLRIMPGWNYIVRLYKPGAAVLDGSFVFPKAMPVK